MKSEKLMEAMTDIDSHAIRNAPNDTPGQQHSSRRLSAILIIAAVLAAMTVTAFAATDIAGWFRSYFASFSEDDLSESQNGYIDDNTQEIGQIQTQDGYTIEVESAFTDGQSAYIKMTLTAPKDTVLDAESYSPGNIGFVSNENGSIVAFGSSWGLVADHDHNENTVGLLCTIDNISRTIHGITDTDASTLVLQIENLKGSYSRNAGTDDYELWYETVAEGTWIFEIEFDDITKDEVELITEPISSRIDIGLGDLNGNDVDEYVGVFITSFKLRAMGAEITYEYEEYVHAAGEFDDIYVVMKDGNRVLMQERTGAIGRNSYRFPEPVIVAEVDYVLLTDGTRLYLP